MNEEGFFYNFNEKQNVWCFNDIDLWIEIKCTKYKIIEN